MKALVLEREAIRRNAAVIKEKAGAAAIYAVLTGDAHGAGLLEMAKLLREEGIGRFAVSEPSDAAALRKAGFVDEEILMLRSTTDREELEQLIDLNAVCTIGSYDTGVALNGLAEARSTVVEAHIQVDTGMGYGGFLSGEPDKILPCTATFPTWPSPASIPRCTPQRAESGARPPSWRSSSGWWRPSTPPGSRPG